MTKKKFIKLFAILAAVFLGSLEMGWRFFEHGGLLQMGRAEKGKKKWFELSHIREIIHRTVMPENIMRVRHGALNRTCRIVISKY